MTVEHTGHLPKRFGYAVEVDGRAYHVSFGDVRKEEDKILVDIEISDILSRDKVVALEGIPMSVSEKDFLEAVRQADGALNPEYLMKGFAHYNGAIERGKRIEKRLIEEPTLSRPGNALEYKGLVDRLLGN